MKRNLDLMRTILLAVEAEADPEEPMIHTLTIEGQDQALVNEHIKLLVDDNLLEGEYKFSTNNRIMFTIIRGLTPRAFNLLDNIRNDAVWKKITDHVSQTVGTASLDVIEKFASQVILAAVSRSK